eukprot:gnl/Dysnectes_brevis/7425_a12416_225.p1 GENE.gnl/Dysnectes_brevis/7425_a12416_225~~gnl/Dysnectes_brevis/7425_a12416_225.p1  ORF type:complete len:264 (+),score=67.04 gnl/Dysnectes_brevis/7425_a12416_225:29-820(+)
MYSGYRTSNTANTPTYQPITTHLSLTDLPRYSTSFATPITTIMSASPSSQDSVHVTIEVDHTPSPLLTTLSVISQSQSTGNTPPTVGCQAAPHTAEAACQTDTSAVPLIRIKAIEIIPAAGTSSPSILSARSAFTPLAPFSARARRSSLGAPPALVPGGALAGDAGLPLEGSERMRPGGGLGECLSMEDLSLHELSHTEDSPSPYVSEVEEPVVKPRSPVAPSPPLDYNDVYSLETKLMRLQRIPVPSEKEQEELERIKRVLF